ncbi:hypothetical protein VTL71DRAFT_16357 [Oculimacula yallundae]|uniref:Uncharacterized protein n=1 Tax=Oculimacula yallundae TaxID=86028 RepID=A0ABR4CE75_9HELO
MLAFMGSEHGEVVSTSFNYYGRIAIEVGIGLQAVLGASRPFPPSTAQFPGRRLNRCRFLPLPIMKEIRDVVPGNTYLDLAGDEIC